MATKITASNFLGVNNKLPPDALMTIEKGNAETFLLEAVNVNLSDAGSFSRRAGFTQKISGVCHSAYGGSMDLVVVDAVLNRIVTADPLVVDPLIAVGHTRLCYAPYMGDVYFSNGQSLGVVNQDGSAEFVSRAGSYQQQSFHFVDPAVDEYFDSTPPGREICEHGARLWSAADDALWYSEAFFPRRCDRQKNYFPWKSATMLAPVEGGLFVGVGKEVWFLSGTDPKQMQPRRVCDFPAVRGTAVEVDAGRFPVDGASGKSVVWESPRGKILGTAGGRIVLLTERNVSYNPGEVGASMLREINGETQHVSSFPSGGDGSNMRTSDIAVAEIRRNGIII